MALNSKSHNSFASGAAPSGSTPAPSGSASAPAPSGSSSGPVTNSTNVIGISKGNIIVDAMPYKVTQCDQVVQITAQTIKDYDDYTSRSPAFFTMSAYMINLFESKDNNKLIESIDLGHIKILPHILQGSKSCMIFKDDVNFRNASICLDDTQTSDAIEKAYGDLMTCRLGGTIRGFDPLTINNVLTASCNGFEKTAGVEYDLPNIRNNLSDELKKAGV
jgi:hypothetical protein